MPCSIVGDAGVRYAWQPADTGVPGFFLGRFTMTYPSAAVESFPDDSFVVVQITEGLVG